MSHYNLVETEFTDPKAVEMALEKLYPGCVEVAPNVYEPTLHTTGYYSHLEAEPSSILVRKDVARRNNHWLMADIGFAYTPNGTFSVQVDNMETEFDLNTFTVEYNVATVQNQYPGHEIIREVQSNGDVILLIGGFQS